MSGQTAAVEPGAPAAADPGAQAAAAEPGVPAAAAEPGVPALAPAPAGRAPVSASPLSAGHAASLATTAGITSVITGMMAVALAAQTPGVPGGLTGLLAGGAIAGLALGSACLYEARNAIGSAMDAGALSPARAAALSAYALASYHLGMGGIFTGLALATAWRVAVPLGGAAWLAPLAACLAALLAIGRAAKWFGAWRNRVWAQG